MSAILNREALEERARNLGSLNGIRLVFVTLEPAGSPLEAVLHLQFYNANSLSDILIAIGNDGVEPSAIFPIRGGSRIRAGSGCGEVQVRQVQAGVAPDTLRLRVRPIGDYSTYTLDVRFDGIDPLFSEIDFKFRPGCFNLNCAPPAAAGQPRPTEPVIDYLARDYDSFKHVLINAMRERVPGWEPTSEADLDQVLIDLIAAQADELCDFQDRVMNEAHLGRVRKRVSLARHARLMDYHIHQGNQATTWLALKVSIPDTVVPAGFGVWTGPHFNDPGAIAFATAEPRRCLRVLNELRLYSWDGVVTALEAGSTEADLALPAPLNPAVEADADTLVDIFRGGEFQRLLIEEKRNPETGAESGIDYSARHLVHLLAGSDAAEKRFDPMAGRWLVRIRWRPEDRTRRRFCFIASCPGSPVVEGISAFHGNLVEASHGRPHRVIFRPPGSPLGGADLAAFVRIAEAHFEPTRRWGVICSLPEGPVAYRKTPPGGEVPPRSTLRVVSGSTGELWTERIDLIESRDRDRHFLVETDELGRSRIRFGNGVNGRPWDTSDSVRAEFQVGGGAAGNIGANTLKSFDRAAFPAVSEVWNPFDVTDGRDPEKPASALRRIPEAYRARQLRAVTLKDYADRARELPEVANAYARYAWTGSWRTVRILIDPAGSDILSPSLRARIADHLEAVRLIGEDLEIRGAHLVSLDIKLTLCAHPDYWPEDLGFILDAEFSDGYTPDGRPGFFHPDEWTFGQPLHASQLIGRALAVQGVDRVLKVSMRRWDGVVGPNAGSIVIDPEDLPTSTLERIDVRPFEIIRVANDPSHMERGRIQFEILGGRR
ncbi:MAG: baseplate J/gp47 family protein [Bryobacteraceae bacterium]